MSKEKQIIEEMAKDICVAEQKTNYSCTEKCKKQGICAYCKVMAEHLYNANHRKQSEWISVEERLPETNMHVLLYVFFHNQWQIVKGWLSYCDKKFHIVNSDYPSLTDIPVTHWMPLPEAPKGGAE